jgi:hypothetical protein
MKKKTDQVRRRVPDLEPASRPLRHRPYASMNVFPHQYLSVSLMFSTVARQRSSICPASSLQQSPCAHARNPQLSEVIRSYPKLSEPKQTSFLCRATPRAPRHPRTGTQAHWTQLYAESDHVIKPAEAFNQAFPYHGPPLRHAPGATPISRANAREKVDSDS